MDGDEAVLKVLLGQVLFWTWFLIMSMDQLGWKLVCLGTGLVVGALAAADLVSWRSREAGRPP
jgi:hypothetical protein